MSFPPDLILLLFLYITASGSLLLLQGPNMLSEKLRYRNTMLYSINFNPFLLIITD